MDRELVLDLRRRTSRNREGRAGARCIDRDVERPGRRHQRLDLTVIGDVAGDRRPADIRRQRFERRDPATGDHDVRAARREETSHRLAEPPFARCPQHQRTLSILAHEPSLNQFSPGRNKNKHDCFFMG